MESASTITYTNIHNHCRTHNMTLTFLSRRDLGPPNEQSHNHHHCFPLSATKPSLAIVHLHRTRAESYIRSLLIQASFFDLARPGDSIDSFESWETHFRAGLVRKIHLLRLRTTFLQGFQWCLQGSLGVPRCLLRGHGQRCVTSPSRRSRQHCTTSNTATPRRPRSTLGIAPSAGRRSSSSKRSSQTMM